MNDNIIKQPPLPNAIQFHTRQNDGMTEVMRITRDEIWVNPFVEVDETSKAVLDALSSQVKVLVLKAVEEEREACAKVVEQYCGAWDDEGYALAQAIRAGGIDGARVGEVGIWGEK